MSESLSTDGCVVAAVASQLRWLARTRRMMQSFCLGSATAARRCRWRRSLSNSSCGPEPCQRCVAVCLHLRTGPRVHGIWLRLSSQRGVGQRWRWAAWLPARSGRYAVPAADVANGNVFLHEGVRRAARQAPGRTTGNRWARGGHDWPGPVSSQNESATPRWPPRQISFRLCGPRMRLEPLTVRPWCCCRHR